MTQEYILLWDHRTVLDLVRPPWEKLLWYSQTTCHVESTGQLRRWGPIVTPSPHVRRTSNSIHSPIFNVKKYSRYCRTITGCAILMRTIHYLPCCNFSSPVLKINIAICLDDKYRHFTWRLFASNCFHELCSGILYSTVYPFWFIKKKLN